MSKKFLLALVLFLGSAVAAAQPAVSNKETRGVRPNAGGEPEQITLRLGVLDMADVEEREQVFTADIFFEATWRDPRLATDDETVADLRMLALDSIWNPRLTVINGRGLDLLLPQVATVDRDGLVVVRQRIVGPLSVDLDLREFPFDEQRFPIEIVSYQYTSAELVFSEESKIVANLARLSDEGWTYTASEIEPFVYRLEDGGAGGSGIVYSVLAERKAAYFALTLALPMTLILFLAWMVHWLPVDVIPARIGTASATVFSLIAFGVSFRLTLPRIAYLTDADRFVLFSTLLVLASLAITVTGIRQVGAERLDAAERLARRTRIAFPLLYGLIIVAVLAL